MVCFKCKCGLTSKNVWVADGARYCVACYDKVVNLEKSVASVARPTPRMRAELEVKSRGSN